MMIACMLFFLSFVIAFAWDQNNPESVRDYVIYVAQREGIHVGEALAIARCESRFNKDALNPRGEYSVGIFQINLKYHPLTIEEAKNPFLNINYAMDLYLEKGWWPWRNCALKHGLLS